MCQQSSTHADCCLWYIPCQHINYCDWLVVVVQVLIFSQMTSILDLLVDYCYLRDFQYSRLDGSMSYSDRNENVSVERQVEEDGAEILCICCEKF